MNVALILSSGVGARFGGNIPKQYLEIDGRTIISFVIDAAKRAETIDRIVIVANHPYIDEMKSQYPEMAFVEGGATRNVSFRNGVDYIKENFGTCDSVIVLDAVRPFVTGKLIDDYINYVNNGYDICVTTKKVTDSLCCLDMPVCDRDRYFMTSSPMSFNFEKLDKYLDKNSKLVEVLQMYPVDTKVFYYYDFMDNYKVTYPEDLVLIKCLMEVKKII